MKVLPCNGLAWAWCGVGLAMGIQRRFVILDLPQGERSVKNGQYAD